MLLGYFVTNRRRTRICLGGGVIIQRQAVEIGANIVSSTGDKPLEPLLRLAPLRRLGLSGKLLLTHLGHLAGRGVRTVFLEVEENNQPARRLYRRTGFADAGRRERYYRQANGEQLNAVLMRRDLS